MSWRDVRKSADDRNSKQDACKQDAKQTGWATGGPFPLGNLRRSWSQLKRMLGRQRVGRDRFVVSA